MKRKLSILLLITISMVAIVGWGTKEVKLLDSSKLIDLNKAIELAKPGGSEGNEREESEAESESNVEVQNDDQNTEPSREHDEIVVTAKNIIIRIRNEQISYTCGTTNLDRISAQQVKARLRTEYSSGDQVILIDDFAEAHTYNEMRNALEKLKTDIGLVYKEDQYAEGE